LQEITSKGKYEILAWCVLIIAAFMPFFAVKEIERVFGEEKLRGMFLRGVDRLDDGRGAPAKHLPS